MAKTRGPGNARLAVERLETRDVPAAGALPAGWSQWSSSGAASFAGTASAGAVASTGTSDTAARSWLTAAQPADVQAVAAVRTDSLIPAAIIVRGQDLDTATPTYYATTVTRGLDVQLLRVDHGTATVIGSVKSKDWLSGPPVRVSLKAQGSDLRVQVQRTDTNQYLAADGSWQKDATWTITSRDTALTKSGFVGLARMARYAGAVTFDHFTVTATPPPKPAPKPAPTPPPKPTLPAVSRHYTHIRIAELAYNGTPLGAFEKRLLGQSVDLVIPNTAYLDTISQVAPKTPQLIYTNVSNLYGGLLTDWLSYADAHRISRESAFLHVNQATPFQGDSSSSRPVNWFWAASASQGTTFTDLTSQSHGKNGTITFSGVGDAVYLGSTDPFREINAQLASGARKGWSAQLEYATAVDKAGNPTAWAPLITLTDTTGRLWQSGRITFDPPKNWVTSSVNGSDRLYYVRFRTVGGGTAPVAVTLLGRDYVGANGGTQGVIPAFDSKADSNHDGYLNDAEYAKRRPGFDARFVYETRAFYPPYGQMRFATNPSNADFQKWAADYSVRYLNSHPQAGGLFADNSVGKVPLDASGVVESLDHYSQDYAKLLAKVNQAVAPRWVLANTAGAFGASDPIVSAGVSTLEELELRPLAQNYVQFQDMAGELAHRQALAHGVAYMVLDSFPTGGDWNDPRTQIATLASYYLLADPQTTFLMFNGGNEPASSWSRHWSPAAAYDVGRPKGNWSLVDTGSDPQNAALTYQVLQRRYDNALVLYKPLSYANGQSGTLDGATATWHPLDGTYRPLRADGSLGAAVKGVWLRNGEGAILVKVSDAPAGNPSSPPIAGGGGGWLRRLLG